MRQTRLSHRSDDQDASSVQPAVTRRDSAPFAEMMSLQSTMGNAAVGSLVRSRERAMSESATPVDAVTQRLIASQRGEVIDAPSPDGVRIHHGPKTDALTRMLGATGFTQGQDVFLRSDRDPASEAGRATLAHELTHVSLGSVEPGAVMREPATDEAIPTDASTAKEGRLPSAFARLVLEKSGEVRGGSNVPGHKGEIEIDSFQFGSTGPVGDKDKQPIEITIIKSADPGSVYLTKALESGERVTSATFIFVKKKDDGTIEDGLTLEFANGSITSYRLAGGGDGPPKESISFEFQPN